MEKDIYQLQDEIADSKNKIKVIRVVSILLAILVLLVAKPMAVRWFSYTEFVLVLKGPKQEVVVGEIYTYVCYTTKSGKCYHDKGCQYLKYSSRKTTVYEAEESGYSPCSRCTPSKICTYKIKTERSPYEDKMVKIQKTPIFLVFAISISMIAALYLYLTIREKIKIKKDEKAVAQQQNSRAEKKEEPVKIIEDEAYIYDTAANGMTVRIPLSSYDQWKETQEKIKNGTYVIDQKEKEKMKAELTNLILKKDEEQTQ